MAYHKNKITKGVLGEFSKIQEEFEELNDAFEQDDKILMFCELSDLLGAIEFYIKKYNLTIHDLKNFSDKTKSSFIEGTRITNLVTCSNVNCDVELSFKQFNDNNGYCNSCNKNNINNNI